MHVAREIERTVAEMQWALRLRRWRRLQLGFGAEAAAELGDALGWDVEGGADFAHHGERGVLGPADFEQIDSAQRHASGPGQSALAEEFTFAEGGQREGGLIGHVTH